MPLLYPRIQLDQPRYSQHAMLGMVSALPATPLDEGRVTRRCIGTVTEVETSVEAMEELFKLVTETMSTAEPIILRCNLPTWQSDEDVLGGDLYDLRALHSKSLAFVHGFIDRLKNAGFQASYKLTISAATSVALVRVTAGDPYAALPQTELDKICSKLKENLYTLVQRDRIYITTLLDVPSAVIS